MFADSISRRWPRIGSLLWGGRDFREFGCLWNHVRQVAIFMCPREKIEQGGSIKGVGTSFPRMVVKEANLQK